MKDIVTVVAGVDARTIKQWAVSLPTIAVNKPDVLDLAWVVFYDEQQVTDAEVTSTAMDAGLHSDVSLVPWSPDHCDCENQRERMLSGFVHVPGRYVRTPWWMKIDTDVVALDSKPWHEESWFETSASWVAVAPGWGYTKPPDQMWELDLWGDTVSQLRDKPRLNLEVGERKCRHRRFCSWVSFYRTDWTREVAKWASESTGQDCVPVPSQDGYHFYCVKRGGFEYRRENMRRRGWTNVPKYDKLVEVSHAVLATTAATQAAV